MSLTCESTESSARVQNSYPANKDSGVLLIGDVPVHWEMRCLCLQQSVRSRDHLISKPTPPRTPEETRAGILALEKEAEGLLAEILSETCKSAVDNGCL